jgi:hypothetical protein
MTKGRIAKMEFASYPTTNHYRCQENAWMDEAVMVEMAYLQASAGQVIMELDMALAAVAAALVAQHLATVETAPPA